ncbi:MAG TPA: DNA-directed RNA polymerase subunit omega [Longimicrobiaceae bacterium]|nr:DNA-directed RNA polymerase subunit omega [Longimicrobiaceae bacterium]
MQVVTPGAVARVSGSKYLGVLVAAKYARSLNEFRRGEMLDEEPDPLAIKREKLTTTALRAVAADEVVYQLTQRKRPHEL